MERVCVCVWGGGGGGKENLQNYVSSMCVCKHNVYQLSVVTAQVPSVPCGDKTSTILCCCSIVIHELNLCLYYPNVLLDEVFSDCQLVPKL